MPLAISPDLASLASAALLQSIRIHKVLAEPTLRGGRLRQLNYFGYRCFCCLVAANINAQRQGGELPIISKAGINDPECQVHTSKTKIPCRPKVRNRGATPD